MNQECFNFKVCKGGLQQGQHAAQRIGAVNQKIMSLVFFGQETECLVLGETLFPEKRRNKPWLLLMIKVFIDLHRQSNYQNCVPCVVEDKCPSKRAKHFEGCKGLSFCSCQFLPPPWMNNCSQLNFIISASFKISKSNCILETECKRMKSNREQKVHQSTSCPQTTQWFGNLTSQKIESFKT